MKAMRNIKKKKYRKETKKRYQEIMSKPRWE